MFEKTTIGGSDWIRMFIFWILMIIMRFAVVMACYPVLNRSGYGITKNDILVIVWGGLRGALGLTLALMVAVDTRLDTRLRELTIFYMSGAATLTLLVNGTTSSSLVAYLKMIEIPPIKDRILKNSIKELIVKTHEKEHHLK